MRHIYCFFSFLFATLAMTGCVEDPDIAGGIRNALSPSVETGEILRSTASSVTVSGEVTRENGSRVTESGFCWSTDPSCPWEEGNKKIVSEGKSAFEATIENLLNDTDYYIRAYAVNEVDTSYGDILSFRTQDGLGSVRTTIPVNIMSTSAQCGGVITVKGEADVEERGVFLMLNPEPSPSDSLIRIDMEADSFYCVITDLRPETTYYVRAYARNKYGTYNGAAVETFRTTNGLPVLANDRFTKISTDFTFVEFSLEVTSEGDSAVTACGFCYGKEPYPTIETADTVVCGNGVGTFSGKIYGLNQQEGYYVRAYATNALGTTYSEGEGVWTVLESELPTLSTTSVSDLRNGTAQVGGEILSVGVSDVTEAGVCWGINKSPTLENCVGSVILSSGAPASFNGTIENLKGGTTYYLRAYARNGSGVAYGNEITFQTPPIFTLRAAFEGAYRMPGSAAFCEMDGRIGFLLGGDQGSDCTDEFWRYIASSNEWRSLKPQPEKLSGQACFCVGLAVWAFGGQDQSGNTSDNMYTYSTYENSWMVVADNATSKRPNGMYRAASCVLDEQVYLVGGRRDTLMHDVWVYTPASNEWVRKSDLPIAQYGGVAAVLNNKVYAGLGIVNRGNPSPEYTRKLWSTDADVTAWTEEVVFPGNALLCAVAYENSLYGVDDSGYIWRYDTNTQTWTRKSRLEQKYRSIHCMYLLDGLIYIGLGTASDSLISYDPTWDN